MQLRLVFPALVSATTVVVSASLLHVVPGEPEAVATQQHRRLLRRAGSTTNEAQFAQISDATQACANANAEGMNQLLKQNVFPKADKIAWIQNGDNEAQQVWQDIQNSNIIPSDVQVKQDNTGGQRTCHPSTDSRLRRGRLVVQFGQRPRLLVDRVGLQEAQARQHPPGSVSMPRAQHVGPDL